MIIRLFKVELFAILQECRGWNILKPLWIFKRCSERKRIVPGICTNVDGREDLFVQNATLNQKSHIQLSAFQRLLGLSSIQRGSTYDEIYSAGEFMGWDHPGEIEP